jgi:hypothetical protein
LQRLCDRRVRQPSRSNHAYHAQITCHAQCAHRRLALKSQSGSTVCTAIWCYCGRPATNPDPRPAQRIRREYSENHAELQEEAVLGCNGDRIPTISMLDACTSMELAAAGLRLESRHPIQRPPSPIDTSCMHSTTSMQLAGCAVRTDRPAEAASNSSRE